MFFEAVRASTHIWVHVTIETAKICMAAPKKSRVMLISSCRNLQFMGNSLTPEISLWLRIRTLVVLAITFEEHTHRASFLSCSKPQNQQADPFYFCLKWDGFKNISTTIFKKKTRSHCFLHQIVANIWMYVNVRPYFSTVIENSKGLRSWKFDPVYANIGKKTCWLTKNAPSFLEKLPNLTLMIYPLSSSDKINPVTLI